MKAFKYGIVGFVAIVISSAHACTILEFASENLLSVDQNTANMNYQEVEAFASGRFPTQPIFTGSDPRLETGLDAPIELGGFGYAVVHYAVGTSGNPTFNHGGSLDFYFIGDGSRCEFIFPQTGPGGSFSNGPISSVALFTSQSVPDADSSLTLFAIVATSVAVVHRFAKRYQTTGFDGQQVLGIGKMCTRI